MAYIRITEFNGIGKGAIEYNDIGIGSYRLYKF